MEYNLKFPKAFYGLLNEGFTVADFELPKDKRPFDVKPENLKPEAIIAEHIVNLLEVELMNSGFNTIFLDELATILNSNGFEFPANLNITALNKIRTTYHNLVNRWSVLNDNQSLEINFDI